MRLTVLILCSLLALGAHARDWSVELDAQYVLTPVADDYDGVHSWRQLNVGAQYRSGFLRAGLERGRDQFYGQPMGRFDAVTLETGLRFDLGKALSADVGVGFWTPLTVQRLDYIIDEMTFTHLVNRHENTGRPIPLKKVYPNGAYPYQGCMTQRLRGQVEHPNCYDSAYTYKTSPYVRFSLNYAVTGWMNVTLQYRVLRARNYIAIGINDGRIFKDPDEVKGGWWMEDGRRNFDTLSVGVRFRY